VRHRLGEGRHTLDLEGTLELVRRAAAEGFGAEKPGLLLVATGGEPSLQLDRPLSDALRARGYRISHGEQRLAPGGPLAGGLAHGLAQAGGVRAEGGRRAEAALHRQPTRPGITPGRGGGAPHRGGDALLPLLPAAGRHPGAGGPNYDETVRAVMALGPPWRLSVQTHKVAAIP
jgi:hypothetical protein